MKNIFRDEKYEELTRSQLEAAQKGLQRIADEWLKLDVGELPDLWDLILDVEKVYGAALYKDIEVPQITGKYQISKDIWVKTVSVPIPNGLYVAVRDCKKLTYHNDRDLWRLEGSTVVMDEQKADALINHYTLTAKSKEEEKLIADLQELTKLLNSCNKRLGQQLFSVQDVNSNRWMHSKWEILEEMDPDDTREQRHHRGMAYLVLPGETIRRWITDSGKRNRL
jgi:hypothetical protein